MSNEENGFDAIIKYINTSNILVVSSECGYLEQLPKSNTLTQNVISVLSSNGGADRFALTGTHL